MRILLDYRPALRERTGVGEYIHQLACATVRTAPAGESLTLFSSSWKDRLSPEVVPGASVIDRRVPVRILNLAWHRLEQPSVETITGAEFDVVQSPHPLLMPSSVAAQVVTIHDLDFLDHPERTRGEIRRDYPALAKDHAQRADHVVVNSAHTGRDVEARLGVPRDRITVCYPGAPDWPARTAEPANGYLLFLGTLEPRKNLGVLLDAYEQLLKGPTRPPSLVLAGRAGADAGPIVERARTAPLAGHVDVRGYVEAADRMALFTGALALVMPSHMEGFGIPAVEAMAIGVPVIAANRGALPETVGEAGRLFDPGDSAALAAAIDEVVRDPCVRARMRDAGRQQARRFQWDTSAARLRDAWASAVRRRRERRG